MQNLLFRNMYIFCQYIIISSNLYYYYYFFFLKEEVESTLADPRIQIL